MREDFGYDLNRGLSSCALADGHTVLSQQTQDLREELARERLKVGALEQELQDLYGQVSNYPWDMALLDQDLRRAETERDVADQAALAARWEREGMQRAYFRDNPFRCRCPIGLRYEFSRSGSNTPGPS
ncbi:hypothetical protein LIER_05555 [Lithospermum erythrorhizon]|uniref:Uncharacterized protein n=1 Tax=Lithospermum erythrorhizon TaxID=34254 RepID=A0AAV3P0X5_LITER